MVCFVYCFSVKVQFKGRHVSTDPKETEIQVRHEEAESIRQEMSDAERGRALEHKNINSEVSLMSYIMISGVTEKFQVSLQLALLMMNRLKGKPKKDQITVCMGCSS